MSVSAAPPRSPSPAAPASHPAAAPAPAANFLRHVIDDDLRDGAYAARLGLPHRATAPVDRAVFADPARVRTRFPPEPNGYLHIGHAKSICLNFGIAREFGGTCNLRMDDTNPAKEDVEYVESILADVRWLIDGWADHCLALKPRGEKMEDGGWKMEGDRPPAAPAETGRAAEELEPFFASDYFGALYECAVRLIEKGLAYVDDSTAEETDRLRLAQEESPYRNRPVAENLDLFARMRAGEFPDGARVLRAKIDMKSPNPWLRDPVLYRIRHLAHHHAGAGWCIYPMYDFAHGLSDYFEGITHSVCTLEFEVHRPLYDWLLQSLDLPRPLPRQYEFARLNVNYTVMSKRKLMRLVQSGLVSGWDDPRMPTISGLRRRGVTASALRNFAQGVGVTKYNSLTDVAVLEHVLRDELNRQALRRLAVLRPLKVVLTNVPADDARTMTATNNPEDPAAGTRTIPFGRELWIERDDFMETPPPKYFRLRPGGEVRLKYACIIRCDEVVKNEAGEVTELRCTADLDSVSGGSNSARKVKGTIHWVSAAHAVPAEVRLYDRLFTVPEPDADGDFEKHLNPHSLEILTAQCEPALRDAKPEERYQFERLAYFALDPSSTPERLVFNRTITLRDAWAKEQKKA